jgi:hypothetical protein
LGIYREWDPPPAWRHAVSCLWEQRVSATRIQRVLPDGHADVLFYSSGRAEIVGIADAVALPRLPPGTSVRGVRLRPEAIGPAFGLPAAALRNHSVGADDLLGAKAARRIAEPEIAVERG